MRIKSFEFIFCYSRSSIKFSFLLDEHHKERIDFRRVFISIKILHIYVKLILIDFPCTNTQLATLLQETVGPVWHAGKNVRVLDEELFLTRYNILIDYNFY